MDFIAFLNNNPGTGAYICSLVALVFAIFIYCAYKLVYRCVRHYTIKEKGWPPAHLNADGEFNDIIEPLK